jgi:hypothetical protein
LTRDTTSGAKYAAYESYGRYPGIAGLVGEQMALPPEWTDRDYKTAPTP